MVYHLKNQIYKFKLKMLIKKNRKLVQNKKCVVFIAQYITPRIERMGYALRKKGYKVILFLHKEGKKENMYSPDKIKSYDEVAFFMDNRYLYMLCMGVKPLVYHVFMGYDVAAWAVFLIKNKSRIGKIVYDQYDIYRDMYAASNIHIIKNEKFCLENADGLVCRSFETQYLKKEYKYKVGGKRLLFLDYCWDKNHVKKCKKTLEDELYIIYGGRLLPRRSNSPLSRIEWEGLSSWIETTKKYSAKMVVVGSNLDGACEYDSFYRLAKKNENFILKEKMNISDLIRYESTMDYGTDTFELEKHQKVTFDNFNFCAREMYSATNKYFDYLDAGIPIICGRPTEMLSRYLEKYGVVVRCTLEELPERMEELKQKRNEYAKNVEIARKELSIENQIGRLIDFYKKINGEKKCNI